MIVPNPIGTAPGFVSPLALVRPSFGYPVCRKR